jgi:Zn-dependent M28 family amino/carboxypeptidase
VLSKPSSIRATVGYIENQWAEMGLDVRRETFDVLGDEASNLIVEKSGVRRPEQLILLGAHYDTMPGTPGADDNASAVAVLLRSVLAASAAVSRRRRRSWSMT